MEKWKKKIKKNDVMEACRMAGLKSNQVYYQNKNKPSDEWSDKMVDVMTNLKSIVEDRELKIKELQGEK